jgi:hypothetical protein
MSEEAKKSNVEMALTVDDGPIGDKPGYVTIGFKIVNKISVDPATGQNIFIEEKEEPNMQSVKVCFACGMIMMKDNKVTYHKYLRNIFADVKRLRLEGVSELGWLHFSVAEP